VAQERSPQTIKSNLWLLGLLHIIVEIFCPAEDALETNWWWQVSSFSSAGASRRNVRQHERRSEPFTYAKTALFGRQTFAVLLGFPLNQEFTWAALRAHACDPINDKLTKRILARGCRIGQWLFQRRRWCSVVLSKRSNRFDPMSSGNELTWTKHETRYHRTAL